MLQDQRSPHPTVTQPLCRLTTGTSDPPLHPFLIPRFLHPSCKSVRRPGRTTRKGGSSEGQVGPALVVRVESEDLVTDYSSRVVLEVGVDERVTTTPLSSRVDREPKGFQHPLTVHRRLRDFRTNENHSLSRHGRTRDNR